jgi:DNA-binding NarL/FixJ family response regulator
METISVIIVDDHPLFREGVRNIIDTEEDLDVLAEGTSGDQALQLIRELNPDDRRAPRNIHRIVDCL